MLFLALRQLFAKKKQSSLTLLGITFGAAAYVVISCMMLGFQTFIIDQLVSNDAQVRISAREEPITTKEMEPLFYPEVGLVRWITPPSGRRDSATIDYPAGWFERLDKSPDVSAYSPQLKVQAIARRAKISMAINLIGSDVVRQAQVTKIETNMVFGKFRDIGTSGNRIIVGDGLLSRLGARAGDTIMVSIGKGEPTPVRIVGVFHMGIKTLDDTTVFAALADVQKINQTPSRISDIAVKLVDVESAAATATRWQALSRESVKSWDQANEGFLSVFKTQDIVRNSMTITILIVAGFGIYNILSMAVASRRREIAILRSIGYEPHDIITLFLSQGVLLGTLGGILGLLLGYALARVVGSIPVSKDRLMGSGNTMIMYYSPLIFVKAFLLAFLSSTFASWLPARAAGKLTPIDIIRSEGT
jgi:lipoprotein-releasing system permease protein